MDAFSAFGRIILPKRGTIKTIRLCRRPETTWEVWMRAVRVLSVVSLTAALALAQLNTTTMDGIVSDPQGALIPNAEVIVTNNLTGQAIRTLTNDRGHWAVPS